MRVYVYSVAANPFALPEEQGFVRAETAEQAVALVGSPNVNLYPLPPDAEWPGEPGALVHRALEEQT